MLSVTKRLVAKRRLSWRRIYAGVACGACSFAVAKTWNSAGPIPPSRCLVFMLCFYHKLGYSIPLSCWVHVHRLIPSRLRECEEVVEVAVGGCRGWHGHPDSVLCRIAEYRLTATAVWLVLGLCVLNGTWGTPGFFLFVRARQIKTVSLHCCMLISSQNLLLRPESSHAHGRSWPRTIFFCVARVAKERAHF